MARDIKKYLEQLLHVYWLRPETALWRCFDCLYMETYGDIRGKSADLGCGDGVMSYIMAGGKLHDYDVFSEVNGLKAYNAGADIFNCAPTQSLKMDGSCIRYNYTWGLDHKADLIAKAQRFELFYERVIVHDLNKPLPSDVGILDSVFSNILYWLKDPGAVMSGWKEKLSSGGRVMVLVPGAKFKEKAWLYYQAPHEGDRRYLNYFDRGYGSLIKHCYDANYWNGIFEKAGYGLVTHCSYLTEPVMNIWNIGTRPIAPLLIRMASRLKREDRDAEKTEWVEYFLKFLLPIVEGEFGGSVDESETAFHFYLLEKK